MAGSNSSLTALWRRLCDMKRFATVCAFVLIVVGMIVGLRSFHQYWLREGLAVIWTDELVALADEICKDAETDEEKVQAIYHWITENIRYDYEAEMVYQNVDISRTVETKKGICFDFATLFAALCRSQGIPCFILDGYSRDNSSYRHTWNRVYYDNRYWNLDVTYDAIQIQENKDILYGFRSIGIFLKVEDDEYVITRIY